MNRTTQDSIVLVIIDRLNSQGEEFGLRTLVTHAQLSDRTISKAITRLEKAGRLRVIRGEYSKQRHQYVVLQSPTHNERLLTALYLGEPVKHKDPKGFVNL